MKICLAFLLFCFLNSASAQQVGIGVTAPVEVLEINGNLKTNNLTLTNSGGIFDFLTRIITDGLIAYKKGHGGIGMNYIICVTEGVFPSPVVATNYGGFIGEIRIFTGDFAPSGWMLCQGQHLRDTFPNTALLSLVGHTYGGTDSTFALPDLRGLVPVGVGTHPSGVSWIRGQKSY